MKKYKLNSKLWYRLVQATYFLILGFVLLIFYSDNSITDSLEEIFTTLIVLEILKRAIYYIAIGDLFPGYGKSKLYISRIKDMIGKWDVNDRQLSDKNQRFVSEVTATANNLLNNPSNYKYHQIELIYDLVTEINYLITQKFSDHAMATGSKVRALSIADQVGIDTYYFTIK